MNWLARLGRIAEQVVSGAREVLRTVFGLPELEVSDEGAAQASRSSDDDLTWDDQPLESEYWAVGGRFDFPSESEVEEPEEDRRRTFANPEDALEYAREIPVPTVIYENPDAIDGDPEYTVYIDY